MAFDFSPFKAVLLDLDGTVYKEEVCLPGAVELFGRLARQGYKIATVSNSTQSPQRLSDRLARMGIRLAPELILTAAEEAADYVSGRFGAGARVFNLATEGVHDLLQGKVTWVEHEDQPCDAVIIANPAARWATVPRMTASLRLLRKGAACLGLCDDRLYPSADGLEIGSGAMTRMLAYAASSEPIFFGKPRREFFEKLCARLNLAPTQCILIGDNLDSDIAGAQGVGMKTILSLTGVARRADVDRLPPGKPPDWIIDDLRSL